MTLDLVIKLWFFVYRNFCSRFWRHSLESISWDHFPCLDRWVIPMLITFLSYILSFHFFNSQMLYLMLIFVLVGRYPTVTFLMPGWYYMAALTGLPSLLFKNTFIRQARFWMLRNLCISYLSRAFFSDRIHL